VARGKTIRRFAESVQERQNFHFNPPYGPQVSLDFFMGRNPVIGGGFIYMSIPLAIHAGKLENRRERATIDHPGVSEISY
jgi:hypothetical protein